MALYCRGEGGPRHWMFFVRFFFVFYLLLPALRCMIARHHHEAVLAFSTPRGQEVWALDFRYASFIWLYNSHLVVVHTTT